MTHAPTRRSFAAHVQGERHAAFFTQAASFEEAALLFAERWSGEGEFRVAVIEVDSGERHCFALHGEDPPSAQACEA